MELLIHPTSRANQPAFKVCNVKGYKFITTNTVEVEFKKKKKKSFYSIGAVEVIKGESKFKPNSQWYYINREYLSHTSLDESAVSNLKQRFSCPLKIEHDKPCENNQREDLLYGDLPSI